jgi:glutathione synthase/RimK-type ligase-like ATP-grasp enzyme
MAAIKKIGILHGKESTFPEAFIARVNEKKESGIIAEAVRIEEVVQGKPSDYAVIIDRISQDVPFYRAYLKNAAISGTAVINNPFWWSADEKFFNNALALKIGVPVPHTVLLPSNTMPPDTNENSFRNLFGHYKWDEVNKSVGFPAYMKPHAGGGWKNVYKLDDVQDFYKAHPQTGTLVMMLQEAVDFTEYFRCYCIDRRDVHIMPYEPRNPHHLRYDAKFDANQRGAKALLNRIKDYTLRLNKALGYDFNTVEFAVRNGVPYAIDFCNPAPDADVNSVGQANFDWIVEAAANMAIRHAKNYKPGRMNLTWGEFVETSLKNEGMVNPDGETFERKKPGPKPKPVAVDGTKPERKKPGPKPKVQLDENGNPIVKEKKKPGRKPKLQLDENGNVIERKKPGPKPKPKYDEQGNLIVPETKRKRRKRKPRVKYDENGNVITPEPKKRGRKPKPRNPDGTIKRRGRKPKPKYDEQGNLIVAPPKKRGRKPKKDRKKPGPKPRVKYDESGNVIAPEPKKRGRKPKPRNPDGTIKKRGRKPKPKYDEQGNLIVAPPKKRGRKPKKKTTTASGRERKKPGPKPKVKYDENGNVITPAPKKRGRKPKKKTMTASGRERKKPGPKPKKASGDSPADNNGTEA